MPMTNTSTHDDSQPSFSNDATVEASPLASKATILPSHHSVIPPRQSYLDVPSFRPSRPSLDSTYSELSELSFRSNELQTQHPLIRSISRDAASPTNRRPPRSRFLTALDSFYVTNYGALLVLLSQLFGAGMNVSTRLLETPGPHGEPMHPFQILFVRQSITAFLCTTYGIYSKSVPHFPFGPRGVRWLLVTRGVSGFFGVFGMYFSLLYLPLSEATVLTFLYPILTCYLCSFVIPGQTFSRQQQLAALVSLVGVVFIAQPASLFVSSSTPPQPSNPTITRPSNSTATPEPAQRPTPDKHLQAIGIAMLGVLGSTGALTSIRVIGTRAHAFISINYFSVWCSIVSLACLIIFRDVNFRLPGNLTEWGLLAGLGLCGFVMQFLLTAGLAYGGPTPNQSQSPADDQLQQKLRDIEPNDPAILEGSADSASEDGQVRHRSSTSKATKANGSGTRATSMVYTQMLFALAGDKLVFGVTPDTMSWIGSVLILAGAVWVASARDSVTTSGKDGADERNGGPDGGGVLSVLREHVQARGKNENGNEEVVGLMSGNDNYKDDDDHYGGRRDVKTHGIVENLEMDDLRPTISGT